MARVLGDWIAETGWMPVLHSDAEHAGFCGMLINQQAVTTLDDGAVAGFMACDDQDITCLYLAPRARGHGWGAAMLQLAQANHAQLGLWTFQANDGAIRFYHRHGFVERCRTDGRGNDERLPDIRLEWEAPYG
jgi:ribosomal protein S18 acetylase RimI-like enzyme